MLQVHNTKVKNIREGYTSYCNLRERAEREGLDFEELKEQERLAQEGDAFVVGDGKKGMPKSAKTSIKKSIMAAKKKFAKANADITIKMKDQDGNVVEFEDEDQESVAKKAKKKKKTFKASEEIANRMKDLEGNIVECEDEEQDPTAKKSKKKKKSAKT